MTITPVTDGKPVGPTIQAYGRGTVNKGGGEDLPTGLWVYNLDERPWYLPVENYKPVAAGEHPRLLFRAGDVAALREKAKTPDGQAIIGRLRTLLGKNGEAMTDIFSTTPPGNHSTAPTLPIGAFTTWHAGGFGFLYQITGDKKYADLSRQAVQFMLDGKYSNDNRYSWLVPGTDLRCGPVLAAMAYAYDFCYDAWPEDFHQKVALEIQNFNHEVATGGRVSIADLVGRKGGAPGSNHYGSLIGGTSVALMSILNDPGTDPKLVELRLSEAESNVPRMLDLGFGDAGWFAEGFGSSSGLSRVGMLQMFQAELHVRGRDYFHPRPNAQWMTLFWVMHLGGTGFESIPNRGVYEGDNDADRDLDMAGGFNSVDDQFKPALMWSYKTFVEAREPKDRFELKGDDHLWASERNPMSPVYMFLGWPAGQKPINPAEVLPKTVVDHTHGYFVARNKWEGSDDIIVTAWLEYGPKGYYSSADLTGGKVESKAGSVRIWGFGMRTALPTNITGGPVTYYQAAKDGSFTFTRGAAALAVDLSNTSGAEAVVFAIGAKVPARKKAESPKNSKATTEWLYTKVNDTPLSICTMQTGAPPKISVEGDTITIGKQTYVWKDGKVESGVFKE